MESSENVIGDDPLAHLQSQYAQLIIKAGVNLQPEQGLSVRAELEHAPFVRRLVAAAYQAGAKYVYVQWDDDPINGRVCSTPRRNPLSMCRPLMRTPAPDA